MGENYRVIHIADAQGLRYYQYIKEASRQLFQLLDLSHYYPHFFDTTSAFFLKLGGYNCSIGSILSNLDTRPIASLLYSVPILGRWFCHSRYRLKNTFEVDLDFNCSKNEISPKLYSSIFFTTLNNYLNPLMGLMQTKLEKGERVLLILPRYSQMWLNYPKVRAMSDLDIVYLEDMFPQDVYDKLDDIRQSLAKSYRKFADSIVRLFNFNGRCFGKSIYPVIGSFLHDFIAPHIIITNYLYDFLQSVTQPDTEFYIARNRRAIENSFVQIANCINGNTNMILHGMVFPDLTTHLFSYNFGTVKKVYVWGQQGRNVIQWRQKMLGEPSPGIVSYPYLELFNKPIKHRCIKGNKLLFAGQSMTHPFIQRIAKRIPEEIHFVVRVHPGHQSKIERYKTKKTNVTIDGLKNPIEAHFINTQVFVSFSSTTILEAIYNDIPTLIINFKELRKYPNVFRKTNLNEQEQAIIMLKTVDELVRKTRLLMYDNQFKSTVLDLNQKMMSHFIDLSHSMSDKASVQNMLNVL